MSAKFPGAIVTDTDLTVASNRARTTLSAGAAAGDVSLTVTSTADFTVPTLLLIEDEIIKATAKDATHFTGCTRAFDGTSAVEHTTGKSVSNFIVAHHFNQLADEVKALETEFWGGSTTMNASKYNFTAQSPSESLIAGGVGQTITLTPVPAGVNGTDTGHYLYLTGANAEAVLITGGTAVAGAATGTITCTPASNHTAGAYTVTSANGGIQEAINAIGATTGYQGGGGIGTGGNRVFVPAGTYDIYGGPVIVPSNVELFGVMGSTYLKTTTTGQTLLHLDHALHSTVRDLIFHINSQANTVCIDLDGVQLCKFERLHVIGGNAVVGKGLYAHCSQFASVLDNCSFNTFRDLHFEIAPSNPIVLEGHGTAGPGVVTENTFHRLRLAGGAAGEPMIDIVQNADSNMFYDVDLSSSAAQSGISVGVGDGITDMQVGGQIIENLTLEGANAAAPAITVGVTTNLWVDRVINLGWLDPPYNLVAGSTGIVIRDSRFSVGASELFCNQGFNFGTTNNGSSIAFPYTNVVAANGLNSDLAPSQGVHIILTGPVAAFSVGGFTTPRDGRVLIVTYTGTQKMTIVNEDAGSAAANRILTSTGADVVTKRAVLVYSGVASRWLMVSPTDATGLNYIASETGADNAIVGSITGVPLTAGLTVTVKLGHALQAGANTFNYNAGGALNIKSSRNPANNIGTAYVAGGFVTLSYDGTQWLDASQ